MFIEWVSPGEPFGIANELDTDWLSGLQIITIGTQLPTGAALPAAAPAPPPATSPR